MLPFEYENNCATKEDANTGHQSCRNPDTKPTHNFVSIQNKTVLKDMYVKVSSVYYISTVYTPFLILNFVSTDEVWIREKQVAICRFTHGVNFVIKAILVEN